MGHHYLLDKEGWSWTDYVDIQDSRENTSWIDTRSENGNKDKRLTVPREVYGDVWNKKNPIDLVDMSK